MRKVVINGKYGGFDLSDEGKELYGRLKGLNLKKVKAEFSSGFAYYMDGIEDDDHYFSVDELERDDPILVGVVTALGEAASTKLSKLKVVEIPDYVEYHIEQYDGLEHVAEKHRTWR